MKIDFKVFASNSVTDVDDASERQRLWARRRRRERERRRWHNDSGVDVDREIITVASKLLRSSVAAAAGTTPAPAVAAAHLFTDFAIVIVFFFVVIVDVVVHDDVVVVVLTSKSRKMKMKMRMSMTRLVSTRTWIHEAVDSRWAAKSLIGLEANCGEGIVSMTLEERVDRGSADQRFQRHGEDRSGRGGRCGGRGGSGKLSWREFDKYSS